MFQPPGFFAQLFDGCRKAKPRQNRRAQRQERPLAAQWRDLADGIERAGGVALEPVEIEAHGPERNERWQDRGVRAVQPALRLGEFVTRETAQFSAGPLGASSLIV
jgi:hypothetical protein